jgi:tripartite-type tricarboxylate transporter receptor subunit TctC
MGGVETTMHQPVIPRVTLGVSSIVRFVLVLTSLTVVMASPARAEWPEKPVTVIVPYAAGGNTDIMARMASDRLSQKFGQPFIVENRAGAGGAIGAQAVAAAANDGYTLMFGSSAQLSILPYIQKVRYDPIKDFTPVGVFGESFSILGIRKSLPATDLRSFVAYVKANPGKVNFASGGIGTTGHLVSAYFAARNGLDIVHVAYKGGAPALTDLLAGQVQMYFGNSAELLPYKDSEQIRLIAVGTPERVKQLPDVPAVAELDPGFSLPAWNGFVAPASTPRAIIDRLSTEIRAIANDPPIAKKLFDLGIVPGNTLSAAMIETVAHEQVMFPEAIKAAGLTSQ